MRRTTLALTGIMFVLFSLLATPLPVRAQQRERSERLCQIRQEKLDQVLPEAMRENAVNMWIVMTRGTPEASMNELLGQGEIGPLGPGYFVFTDRGGSRIERARIGVSGALLEQCKSYDLAAGKEMLRDFVTERDPKRIAVSDERGAADDELSRADYKHLLEALGKPYVDRLVPAEKVACDFRSRRVVAEMVALAQAGELSRTLIERALSNQVITPDKTTLKEVAWWLSEQPRNGFLGSTFGFPAVLLLGPGEVRSSEDHIIRPGELLSINWGVGYLNAWTPMTRVAYVLEPGENAVPPGIQRMFDRGMAIRDVLYRTIKPGVPADSTRDLLNRTVESMSGYKRGGFNSASADISVTDFIIGVHSTGDRGKACGPWLGPEVKGMSLMRTHQQIRTGTFLLIKFFAATAVPEWGGQKLPIGLEDGAVVTERGIEWVYPPSNHILLIK